MARHRPGNACTVGAMLSESRTFSCVVCSATYLPNHELSTASSHTAKLPNGLPTTVHVMSVVIVPSVFFLPSGVTQPRLAHHS
jgi:hypothetical protein